VRVCFPGRFGDRVERHVLKTRAVTDVFPDRTVEQDRFLRDQPYVFSQMFNIYVPDVAVVYFLRDNNKRFALITDARRRSAVNLISTEIGRRSLAF